MVALMQASINAQVIWQSNGCDFAKNDLSNVQSTLLSCGPNCIATTGCTHFSWTSYNGGTCWMKYGSLSQTDATLVKDQTAACGIVKGILCFLFMF